MIIKRIKNILTKETLINHRFIISLNPNNKNDNLI